MAVMPRLPSIIFGVVVLALGGCGQAASPDGGEHASPASPTAAPSALAVPSAAPGQRLAGGDMLIVLADIPIRDTSGLASEVTHALLPGDRAWVASGPVTDRDGDWYEIVHHGIGGWVPAADGGQPAVALDAPKPGSRVLRLVKFGDSSTPSPDLWTISIEQHLGVDVRTTDYFSKAGGTPADIVQLLTGDASVRAAVAEADVIGIEMNPSGTRTGDALRAVCVANDPTPRDPPAAFTVQDFDEFAALWRQAYREIFALRAGRPTIIRAFDMYVPVIDAWKAAGIQRECTAGWEAFSTTVKLVAAEYGVPVVSMYDALNGPNHDEDPVDKGYLDVTVDDKHLNERGRIAQIAVVDALGYEFPTP